MPRTFFFLGKRGLRLIVNFLTRCRLIDGGILCYDRARKGYCVRSSSNIGVFNAVFGIAASWSGGIGRWVEDVALCQLEFPRMALLIDISYGLYYRRGWHTIHQDWSHDWRGKQSIQAA